jgi:hypothetical protein
LKQGIHHERQGGVNKNLLSVAHVLSLQVVLQLLVGAFQCSYFSFKRSIKCI